MSADNGLTTFQIDVARVFFGTEAAAGYVVAGGAALLASELINRPTQDLDLFASAPVFRVTDAKEALVDAAVGRSWVVTVIHDTPTFCRLIVAGDGEVLVDLALDSPPVSPTLVTVLGPTLAPLELAGRKVLALFGRAEARDFADVFVLAQHFGVKALLVEAAAADPGFSTAVMKQMIGSLDRFVDDEIPLPVDDVPALRSFFLAWAEHL
jgi:hypothetical protein